jgi:hypothetical protein
LKYKRSEKSSVWIIWHCVDTVHKLKNNDEFHIGGREKNNAITLRLGKRFDRVALYGYEMLTLHIFQKEMFSFCLDKNFVNITYTPTLNIWNFFSFPFVIFFYAIFTPNCFLRQKRRFPNWRKHFPGKHLTIIIFYCKKISNVSETFEIIKLACSGIGAVHG